MRHDKRLFFSFQIHCDLIFLGVENLRVLPERMFDAKLWYSILVFSNLLLNFVKLFVLAGLLAKMTLMTLKCHLFWSGCVKK